MRNSFFCHNGRWTLGLIVFSSLIFTDAAWAQQRGGNRGGGRPRDNTFLTAVREDRTFASDLKLTKEQEEKILKLREESYGLFRKGLNREEFIQAAKEIEEKAIALLDENQKAVWEKRKQDNGGGGNRTDSGSSERSSQGDSGSILTAPASTSRSTIPDEKPPEGEIAVVSFGVNAVAKASKDFDDADVGGPGAANSKAVNGKEEPKLRFTFRYAPWADVLKLFADINDLTLDLNDVPAGTFNYYDDHSYTMTQALDILNGYLLSKGYVLVRRDRFLVCVSIDNGPIPPNYIPSVTEDELPSRGKNELLSLMLPLEGLEADKMVTEIEPLLGPLGSAKAMKSSNTLILTGIGSNLRRISTLLKTIKPVFSGGDNVFRAISLKHITAIEAERTVRKHFGLSPVLAGTPTTTGFTGRGGGNPWGGGGGNPWGGGGGGWGGGGWGGGGGGRGDRGGGNDPTQGGGQTPGGGQTTTPGGSSTANPFSGKIQVTADARLNILIVTATTQLIKLVEDIVKSLDTKPDLESAPIESPPATLQQYTAQNADVASVAQMLNALTNGAVIGFDARSGKIYAQVTKEQHAEILKLLKSTAVTNDTVAVIQLSRLEPVVVTNSLRNLFVNEGTRAPSIEADANGRRIIVRGTSDQLMQVKSILREMGEKSVGGPLDGENDPNEDRGSVRKLHLGGLDPKDVARIVEQTWNGQGRNPIRVVIPSQFTPSPIRDRRVPSATLPEKGPGTTEFEPTLPRPSVKPKVEAQKSVPIRSQSNVTARHPKNHPETESLAVASAKKRPVTTQIFPRRIPVIQASQVQESESQDDPVRQEPDSDGPADESDEPPAVNSPSSVNSAEEPKESRRPEPKKQPSSKSAQNQAGNSESQEPLTVMVLGNELVISGGTKEERDQLEDMFSTLIGAIPQRTQWTVFYLRTADATECAQMLERLFPQSSVTTTPTGSDGLFGGLTSGLSTFGRGMMNATGLNQTLGGNNLRIITDVRANALFVTGSPETLNDVEQMLQLLDSSELPGTVRDRLPRSIPVEYADIDEVAEIIESVFKDQMTPEQQQQQGGPGGFNPLAAMFGGGGRGGGGNQPRKPPVTELSVGVDRRTSHLIVQCNETMFHKVETMVQAIDQRAKEANRTVRMIALSKADPLIVQSTLSSLIPKVTVSATRSRPRRGKAQDGTTPGTPGSPTTTQPPEATRDQQLLQQMMDRNNQASGFGGQGWGNQGGGGRGGNGGGRGGNFGGGGGNFGGGGRGGRQGN